jgi:peptide/nickel transport system substrate-binding protein
MRKMFVTLVMVAFAMGFTGTGLQEITAAPAPAKPASPPTLTPQYGGILKILYSRESGAIGYPPLITGIGIFAGRPALQPLLDFDSSGRFRPTYLATDWKMAADGLSGTMILRKGVKFHDGTDFNADAVKWNLEKLKAQKYTGTDIWKSIEVIDPSTVRINLTQVDCTFEMQLSLTPGTIISPTAYEKNGQTWTLTHPVGTGPYKLKSYERDASIKYERFDDYWGGKPYLDGIEFYIMADPMVQQAAFRAGEGHAVVTTTAQYANDLKASGYIVAARMDTILSMSPDSRNPDSALSNKKVREALEYAIDKVALTKMGYGYWRPAYQWSIPEYPVSYNSQLKPRTYDPAKAKQLLAEAGYPNGFKTRLIFDMTHKVMDPMTVIQSYWKAVGVDAELQQLPRAEYISLRTNTVWHNGFLVQNNALIPSNYLPLMAQVFSPGFTGTLALQRPAGWGDGINKARAARTPEEIKAHFQGLVKTMYDEAMIINLYSWCEPSILDKRVQGSNISGLPNTTYTWTPETAWLSK